MVLAEHVCLFCGEPIAPTGVDPCSAVIGPAPPEDPGLGRRGRVASAAWWRRPPGQYWMHSACLRKAAHPSVSLHFLDIVERG